jgi:hypothetical protein
MATEKKCTKCGTVKPLEEFVTNNRSPSGKAGHCRECAKEWRNSKQYKPRKRGSKTCSQCKKTKPVKEFHVQKSMKDGLKSYCRDCAKVFKDNWYKKTNKYKQAEINRDLRASRISAKNKACSKCKKVKPKSRFSKHSKASDGLMTACKECMNKDRFIYYRNSQTFATAEANRKKASELKRKKLKVCTGCKETKPYSHFYILEGRPAAKCKACSHMLQQAAYEQTEVRKKAKAKRAKTDALFKKGLKQCTGCGRKKKLSLFYKSKNGLGGHAAKCRHCQSERYHATAPERSRKEKEQRRKAKPHLRRHINEKMIKKGKAFCFYCKKYHPVSQYHKNKGGRFGLSNLCRSCKRRHYHENENHRIAHLLRGRLRTVLANVNAQKHVSAMQFGLPSTRELIAHLAAQFKPDMSLQNTDIDHWMPLQCEEVDLHNPIHQRAVCHYTNLRPMWPKANTQKSNKVYKAAYKNFLRLVAMFEAENKGAA